MAKPKQRRIVEVEWEDTASDHGWSKDGVRGLAILDYSVISVGIVVQDDERGLLLAFGLNPDPESTHPHLCPTELGPKRSKKR